MPDSAKYTVAVAGNPNSGKTMLFNRLTNSNQKVSNWGGVTTEKTIGKYIKANPDCPDEPEIVHVIDLPGLYSLTPSSAEEIIAYNCIIDEKPDLVVNIVDASNLDRNLYLTLRLKERGCPMVIALGMMDEVEQNGTVIDIEKMSRMIGVPIVPISSVSANGFLSKIARLAGSQSFKTQTNGIDVLVQKINDMLDKGSGSAACDLNASFDFSEHQNEISKDSNSADSADSAASSVEIYAQIEKIISATVSGGKKSIQQERSEKIDSVLTHKWFGIPIFLILMGVIFYFSFGSVSSFFSTLIQTFFNVTLAGFIQTWFDSAGAAAWMSDLLIHGVIAGVSGVLVFIPQLSILFLFLTLLEDTGYLARVAFLLDRLFSKLGLSGKSFIPMLIGFGCSVPALMMARMLDHETDRKTLIIITPFMSCSAKLPIYVLFVGTFFAAYQGLILFSLYVLGIAVAVFSAWLFRKTIFKGPESPFLLELPPYRLPDFSSLKHVWEKIRGFLVRAGTIILLMSVVFWFSQGYDYTLHSVSDTSDSILGFVGSILAPLFKPIGFSDWRATVSLLAGIISKEFIVSAVNIMYTPAEFNAVFGPASALAFMVFTLLYIPCVAAFTTMKRELNSLKWTAFAVFYQTSAAYILAFVVYRVGLFVTARIW